MIGGIGYSNGYMPSIMNNISGGESQKINSNGASSSGECQTCASRTYVDGSNDAGVSFKSPTHVSSSASAGAVMSHEQEHVSNNQAKASAEGRKVVSSSVQIYTATCPECGKAYTSGGKTTTVTANDNKPSFEMKDIGGSAIGSNFDKTA